MNSASNKFEHQDSVFEHKLCSSIDQKISFFAASFIEAKMYADKFRALPPVVYNPACLNSPRPPNVTAAISNRTENDSDTENGSDTENDSDSGSIDENEVNVSNNHTEDDSNAESIDENEANVRNEHTDDESNTGSIAGNETNVLNEELESTFYESSPNVTTERTEKFPIVENEISVPTASDDVKDLLEMVVLNESEISIFDHIFDENVDIVQPNEEAEESTNDAQQPANVTIATSPGGTKTFTEDIGDDCVLVYESVGENFRPQQSGFQVKINDLLSGNIPFKENVSLLNLLCDINSIFNLII